MLAVRADILNMSFNDLISSIGDIEKKIASDAFDIIEVILQKNGFVKNSNHFIRNKSIFNLEISIDECSRSLNVLLTPLNYLEDIKSNSSEINEFGLLQKVNVISCASILAETVQISTDLCNFISELYLSIEQSLIFHAENANNRINNRLDYHLKQELSKIDLSPDFFRKYRFYIFHEGIGICLVDATSLKSIIKHFKLNQHERYSPLQLTIWILTEKIPFEHSLTRIAFEEKRTLKTPWSEARFISEATKAYISNSQIFDFIDYKIFPIDSKRNYVASIIYSEDIEGTLEPLLQNLHPLLKVQFQEDIARYSFFYKTISKIRNNIKSAWSNDKVDLISSIVSKTLVKIYNGIKIE